MALPLPNSWRAPSAGKWRSWLPQPSSAGCAPSPVKPSIDQVLTNSPGAFGVAPTCVSRSATWMTLTPSRDASAPQAARSRRRFPPRRRDRLRAAAAPALTEMRHQAGIGAVGDAPRSARRDICCAAPARFRAARSWSAAQRRQRRIGVAARPGLDAGVEVHEHVLALAPFDQRDARHFDRDVEQEIAVAQQRIEDALVIAARQRFEMEGDAVRHGLFMAAFLGGDDGDLIGADADVTQQQRQHALADAAEADHGDKTDRKNLRQI